MEETTQVRLGEGAEPIESGEWLREFDDRYTSAWNALDPDAVAACVAEDVIWVDPALAEPLRGRGGVSGFVQSSRVAFPDLHFEEAGALAIAHDRLAAYAPWRMTGTNTGPIDPPGLPPTGKRVSLEGIDVWQFRGGLIWRYRAVYDFAELSRQLGLMPPRGGRAETLMVRAQRLRSKLPV